MTSVTPYGIDQNVTVDLVCDNGKSSYPISIAGLQTHWPKSGLFAKCEKALAARKKEIYISLDATTLENLCTAINSGNPLNFASFTLTQDAGKSLGWKNNGDDLPFNVAKIAFPNFNNIALGGGRICRSVWNLTKTTRQARNVFAWETTPVTVTFSTVKNHCNQLLYACIKEYGRIGQFLDDEAYAMRGCVVIHGNIVSKTMGGIRLQLQCSNVRLIEDPGYSADVDFDITFAKVTPMF